MKTNDLNNTSAEGTCFTLKGIHQHFQNIQYHYFAKKLCYGSSSGKITFRYNPIFLPFLYFFAIFKTSYHSKIRVFFPCAQSVHICNMHYK